MVDLVGDWELGDAVTFRLGIFNLFDEEYAHWQNVQGLDPVRSAQAIANALQPGTNLRLGFNVEF